MNKPDLQNDLSYFRRTVQRRGRTETAVDFTLASCISTEEANEMSLFYAEHTPMLKALTEAAISFVEQVLVDFFNLIFDLFFIFIVKVENFFYRIIN